MLALPTWRPSKSTRWPDSAESEAINDSQLANDAVDVLTAEVTTDGQSSHDRMSQDAAIAENLHPGTLSSSNPGLTPK